MPYEHEKRQRNFRKASQVLGEQPVPFEVNEVFEKPDSVVAFVNHVSSGFEPLIMQGVSSMSDGESKEMHLARALSEASGMPTDFVNDLATETTAGESTTVFLIDKDGEGWVETSENLPSALLTIFAAKQLGE